MGEVIVFSGLAGVGTTTLSKDVARMLGWERYTAGPYFRAKGKELGIPLEETTKFPHDFHREVDELMLGHMTSGDNLAIEGWLQCWNAYINNVNSKRVFVKCSDKTRFERIAIRDGVSVVDAKMINLKRERENAAMFHTLYRIEDFTNPMYYTHFVSSEQMKPRELAIYTLGELGLLDSVVNEF